MYKDVVNPESGRLNSMGGMEGSQCKMGKQHSTDDVNATMIPRLSRAQSVFVSGKCDIVGLFVLSFY